MLSVQGKANWRYNDYVSNERLTITEERMHVIESIGSIHRHPFAYHFDAVLENDNPRDHFGDDEEILESIYNGDLEWFAVRGTVELNGTVLGQSHLSCCCYADSKEFLEDGAALGMSEELEIRALSKLEEFHKIYEQISLLDQAVHADDEVPVV
jgi:hypothetical protein